MSHQSRASLPLQLLKTTLALGVLSVGALGALNTFLRVRTPVLGPRLNGFFDRFPARYGDLAYVVAGSGAPVLLLHGLEPGRSMAEWRAIFDELAKTNTVYALDFQGYGLSDSSPEGLSADGFAEQISSFIRDIIGGETAVVAAGGGAILALLALQNGAPISQIALVCPVPPGFDAPSADSRGEALLQKALTSRLLNAPILGEAVLNWWRSKSQLEKRARHAGFFDKEQAQNEVKLWHTTSHQEGAGLGARAFLEGRFQADWRSAWKNSVVPALLLWGRNATQGYDGTGEWLALRPDATLEVVDQAMDFPHLERAGETLQILQKFLRDS